MTPYTIYMACAIFGLVYGLIELTGVWTEEPIEVEDDPIKIEI